MGFFFWRRDYAEVAYRALAQGLGLPQAESAGLRIEGRLQDAEVLVVGNRKGSITELVVHGPHKTPKDLFLFPADGVTQSSVPSFDPSFDRRVHVGGDRLRIAALMNASTREALAEIVHGHRAIFTNGCFRLGLQEPLAGEMDGRRFARFIQSIVRLCWLLAHRSQAPIPELLMENALREPLGVRNHNLRLLVERYPTSWETAKAARAALAHHDASLRLCGACFFARREPPELRPLTDVYLDDRVPLEARELALCLALDADPEASARLRAVLEVDDLVPRALDEHLARGVPADPDVIAELLRYEHAARPATVRYVADLGLIRFEPDLARILAPVDSPSIDEAIAALARIGRAHGAEALLELAHGPLTPPRLKRSAFDAVDRIRERGGYDAGRLSLVSRDDAGSLAMAEEAARGAISQPRDD